MNRYVVSIDSGFGSDYSYLEWTTKPPTKVGWYWVYVTDEESPFCVLYDGADGLSINWLCMGYEREFEFEEEKITHWLGPLPIPDAPKGNR